MFECMAIASIVDKNCYHTYSTIKLILHLFFIGSDMLIQCMSTSARLLLNQTFYWSNVALKDPDVFCDKCQCYFYRISNSSPLGLKFETITTTQQLLLVTNLATCYFLTLSKYLLGDCCG